MSFSDFYTFELDSFEWKKFFMLEFPGPRDCHSMVKIGDEILIYGGKISPENITLWELWSVNLRYAQWSGKSLDVSGCVWEQKLIDSNGPGPLRGHSACVTKGEMLIFGGVNIDYKSSSNVFIYTPLTNSWRCPEFSGHPPIERHSHSCSSLKNETVIVVFGGIHQRSIDDF